MWSLIDTLGISRLPVSTIHTTVSLEGPIAPPMYIPQEIARGEYIPDEYIPENTLKAKQPGFLKTFLLKSSKAARHV